MMNEIHAGKTMAGAHRLLAGLVAVLSLAASPGIRAQEDLYGLAIPSPGRVIAVGDAGTILLSTNAGESWSRALKPPTGNAPLFGVVFTDSLHGWIAAGGGFQLTTTDGGSSWDTLPRITGKALFSVGFRPGGAGWFVGASGTILASNDGGHTWHRQHSLVDSDLRSVWAADSGAVIVTGSRGTILRTSDGGGKWETVKSDVNSFLYSLGGPGEGPVWAVGGYGTILRTTDAGKSWGKQNLRAGTLEFLNPMAFYQAVAFSDSLNGIVAGSLGTLLSTADGGTAWTIRESLPDIHAYCLRFEPSTGAFWIAGSDGAILRSADGGTSWEQKHPPETNEQ